MDMVKKKKKKLHTYTMGTGTGFRLVPLDPRRIPQSRFIQNARRKKMRQYGAESRGGQLAEEQSVTALVGHASFS